MHSDRICNCREPSPGNMKIRKVIVAFWCYLKGCFETTEKFWKWWRQMVPSAAIRYDIMTCRDKFLKQCSYMVLHSFISASDILHCPISWLYQRRFSLCVWTEIVSSSFMSRLVVAHPLPPLAHIFISFLGTVFFWLSRKSYLATPDMLDPVSIVIYWIYKWQYCASVYIVQTHT